MPQEIIAIFNILQKANFLCFLVGGSVRNLLMQLPVKDWDFTTSATPQDILKLFPEGFYDNTFGTVGLPIKIDGEDRALPAGRQVIEITTFRTEHGYSDKRRPDKVVWGKTIEEDLARRDFTINAIALRFAQGKPSEFEIIDPYHGKKDIEQKIIRAVGEADKRFKEDALRLVRAIRIATELSFTIEQNTWQAIMQDAQLIGHVSGERIRTELMRIIASEYPFDGIMLLKNATLLNQILPELIEGIGVSQERPGRHHTTDVFTHNVMSLKHTPATDSIVRFATLLHDVGKSRVVGQDDQGLVTFYNHEIVGAKIAYDIADRLRFSKKDRGRIVNLIRWHMFTVDEKITDAAVRRFIRRVGVENVKDMMDLRIGDRLGGGTQTAESWRLKLFKKRIEDQLKPKPFSIDDMEIDGNDVMRELNIKPGPKVGEILQKLFEEVDEDLSKNTREYLLKRIKYLE